MDYSADLQVRQVTCFSRLHWLMLRSNLGTFYSFRIFLHHPFFFDYFGLYLTCSSKDRLASTTGRLETETAVLEERNSVIQQMLDDVKREASLQQAAS